jgi:hypothetical protein
MIKVHENFISSEEVNTFLEIFEKEQEKLIPYGVQFSMYMLSLGKDNFDGSPFFESPKTFSELLPDYTDFLKDYHKRLEETVKIDSGKDNFWCVSWLAKTVSGGLKPHGDNADGAIYVYDYTTILYLNECKGGGDIFFPEHDFAFSPKPGTLISFPADYEHGVVPTVADRYAVPSWFTTNKEYALLDTM